MSITLMLVLVTCLISYQAMNNPSLLAKLVHSPYREKHQREYYRMLTSGFIHSPNTWAHLAVNMLVLYQFGEIVERFFVSFSGPLIGRINYLLLYLLTIVLASLPSFLKHQDNYGYSALGASGAVSGVMCIFALLLPWDILLLFFIIPCPAILALVLYLLYSQWADRNQNDNIGHDAHFFGAILGGAIALGLYPQIIQIFLYQLIEEFPLG
ncbi:MAG: rhomboid family intramembrane serine protease [Bacteroidota bacterium]